MGMDWHSSGITTSVMGALKRGLNPRFSDFGLLFAEDAAAILFARPMNSVRFH